MSGSPRWASGPSGSQPQQAGPASREDPGGLTWPRWLAATVLTGLRWWAQGALSDQAAVEILARSFGGRYLQPGAPGCGRCGRPGWYWLDADALAVTRGDADR